MKHLPHLLGASLLLLTGGAGELHSELERGIRCICVDADDTGSLAEVSDDSPRMSGVTIALEGAPVAPDAPQETAWCEGSDDPRCSSLPAPRDTTQSFASPLGALAQQSLRPPTAVQVLSSHDDHWDPCGIYDRIERPPQA